MNRLNFKSETRITALYFLLGGLWILLTDRLLVWLSLDLQKLVWLQTFKGWFFILASGMLLFFLLHSALQQERRTHAQLDEANERFRLLFETSLDAVLLTLPDGSILNANPAACRMLGRSEGEIRRLGRDGLVDRSDQRLAGALKERQSAGKFEGELDFLRANGETFPCEVLSAAFLDRNGKPLNATIIRDISAQKRAEMELRENEALYRQLAENINEVLMLRDTRTKKVIYVNPAYERVMGRSTSAAYEKSHYAVEAIHPDDRARVEKAFIDGDDGKMVQFEYRLLHADGSTRWLRVHSYPLFDASGIPYRAVVLAEDFTERKRAEDLLLENEARYHDIFEHSPISLWEEDFSAVGQRLDSLRRAGVQDFRAYFSAHPEVVREMAALVQIVDINRTTLELFEAERKEDLLTNLARVFIDESYTQFQNELVSIAMGEREFGWEVMNQTLKGKPIYISMRWSVVPGHEEDLSKVIISLIDITARKKAEARIQRQVNFLTALQNIDRAIASSFDLRLSLNALMAQSVSLLAADAASVLLYLPAMNRLEYAAGIGFKTRSIEFAPIRISESYAGRAVQERTLIHIPDLWKESPNYFHTGFLSEEGFISYWGVPLIVKGKVIGVLEIFKRSLEDHDQEWVEFLNSLASQAAIAIDNAHMFESSQRANLELALAYDATIEGWSRALDLRDRETEGHTRRVTEKTLAMAALMQMDEAEKVHMRRGALLHDIGKLGVPDQILFKPGGLDEHEWEIMRKHPVFAYEMLSPIEYLRNAIDIPYCHHEKWDGSGYPRGLKGEEIPLSARIFTVVDIWDALNSNRPYRLAWEPAQIREYIRSISGTHLDPAVVQVFLNSGLA